MANLRAEKNTIRILPLSLTEKTYATRFGWQKADLVQVLPSHALAIHTTTANFTSEKIFLGGKSKGIRLSLEQLKLYQGSQV